MKSAKKISKSSKASPRKARAQKAPATKPASMSDECRLEVSYAAPESYFIPTEDDDSTQEPLVLFGAFDQSPSTLTEVQIFRKVKDAQNKETFEEEDEDRFKVVDGSIRVKQFNELHMRVFIHYTAYPGAKFFTVKQYSESDGEECIVEKADVAFELNSSPTS